MRRFFVACTTFFFLEDYQICHNRSPRPEVELKDILCRLKPDFNAVRVSRKKKIFINFKEHKRKLVSNQTYNFDRKPIFFLRSLKLIKISFFRKA